MSATVERVLNMTAAEFFFAMDKRLASFGYSEVERKARALDTWHDIHWLLEDCARSTPLERPDEE